MRFGSICLLLLLAAAGANAGSASPDDPVGTVEFVESWPQHTVLDLPDLRDAPEVWRDVLGAAERRIDLAGFYFSRKGDGNDSYGPASAPDLLLPVLAAVEGAALRGVKVRTLADAKFAKNYPDVPKLLGALPGAEARLFDAGRTFGGSGILHAKYFLVDDDGFYIGSQNFDWRALGQIHELGVLVDDAELAAAVRRIFEWDWQAAGDPAGALATPVEPGSLDTLPKRPVRLSDGVEVEALVAASPAGHLPEGVPWDLPLLVQMIDSARDSVHVQLLSYGVTDREKRVFDDLDSALKRAAVRGVQVRVILSNWAKTKYALPWIEGLALIPNLEVRFTNIPEHPDGFIPFARVEHAKYLTVDANRCWVGTSNWSRDYFYDSRNLGLILTGDGAARDCDRFFNLSWRGPYAEAVVPGAEYVAPRRN